MVHLAKTVLKEITSRVKSGLEEIPKRAVKWLGPKSTLRELLSVSKTLDQKSVSQGNSRTYGDGRQETACSGGRDTLLV